jgi:hypothetical protein
MLLRSTPLGGGFSLQSAIRSSILRLGAQVGLAATRNDKVPGIAYSRTVHERR